MQRTQTIGQQPTPGDLYIAAATAEHHAHCTNCRERAAASDAAAAVNAASMARRDRIQLGLHLTPRPAVTQ